MQHFFVLKANNWKRWGLILTAALFTAFYLWVEADSSFSVFSTEENPAALSKGSPDDPYIALTFNISWGNEKVEPILEKLKSHNAKATFFVSGEWAERHPELLKKIEDDGHEIGMMGYQYKSYIQQDLENVRKDLVKAKDIFKKLGYSDTKILRPPSGHFNKEILQLTEKQGYQVIQWNVNPKDWENPGQQKIIDHVMKNTSNGDIILLHASDSVKQTPKALDTILPGLKNKGFEFISITEMISRADSESKEIN